APVSALLLAGRQHGRGLRRAHRGPGLPGAGRAHRDRARGHHGSAARAEGPRRPPHAGPPAHRGLSRLPRPRLPPGGLLDPAAVLRGDRGARRGREEAAAVIAFAGFMPWRRALLLLAAATPLAAAEPDFTGSWAGWARLTNDWPGLACAYDGSATPGSLKLD